MRRLAVWTVLMTTLGAFTILPAGRARAECRLDEGTGITSCRLYVQPVPDRAIRIGDGRTSAFVWWSMFWYNAGLNPFGLSDNADCRRDTVDGPTTTSTYGNIYLVQLRTSAGVPVTDASSVCVFEGN